MSSVVTMPPGAVREPEEVLAQSGSNFQVGFLCLDAPRRAGMTAIYAFCRVADDAADDTPDLETGAAHLAYWRDELHAAAAGHAKTPVGRGLTAAMTRFEMPSAPITAPLEALLDGVHMDLEPSGFADEDALRHYCDCVASAVGRACLPVLGVAGEGAERFATALGQALQFTNILRDLRTDAESGRVYAPRTWLEQSGVEEGWLRGDGPAAAYVADGPIARLRARFVDVADAEFAVAHEALRALPRLARRALVPARIMGAVYGNLLRRLAARGGVLDAERVNVPRAVKILLVLQVFAGVRT